MWWCTNNLNTMLYYYCCTTRHIDCLRLLCSVGAAACSLASAQPKVPSGNCRIRPSDQVRRGVQVRLLFSFFVNIMEVENVLCPCNNIYYNMLTHGWTKWGLFLTFRTKKSVLFINCLLRLFHDFRDLVDEAKNYLLLPQERPLMQGPRTRPRKPIRCGEVLFAGEFRIFSCFRQLCSIVAHYWLPQLCAIGLRWVSCP